MSSPTRVTINSASATRVAINNQQRQQIRTVGLPPNLAAQPTALSDLTDIDIASAQDGDTLVYNAATGKFVAQTALDGGTF